MCDKTMKKFPKNLLVQLALLIVLAIFLILIKLYYPMPAMDLSIPEETPFGVGICCLIIFSAIFIWQVCVFVRVRKLEKFLMVAKTTSGIYKVHYLRKLYQEYQKKIHLIDLAPIPEIVKAFDKL